MPNIFFDEYLCITKVDHLGVLFTHLVMESRKYMEQYYFVARRYYPFDVCF